MWYGQPGMNVWLTRKGHTTEHWMFVEPQDLVVTQESWNKSERPKLKKKTPISNVFTSFTFLLFLNIKMTEEDLYGVQIILLKPILLRLKKPFKYIFLPDRQLDPHTSSFSMNHCRLCGDFGLPVRLFQHLIHFTADFFPWGGFLSIFSAWSNMESCFAPIENILLFVPFYPVWCLDCIFANCM